MVKASLQPNARRVSVLHFVKFHADRSNRCWEWRFSIF